MVIPFPAAVAAPQPISTLLARCIGFLEGFEDDPEQCVAPLLTHLRATQDVGLVVLTAPSPAPTRFSDYSDWAQGARNADGSPGFCISRYFNSADRWYWSAVRIDDDGHRWRTSGAAVMDDFGSLVEVRMSGAAVMDDFGNLVEVPAW
jgi:hypothetical protein